jgi:hypothetical protein
MKLKDLKWTKPFYGVTHLGELDHTNVRISVIDYGKCVLLIKYPRYYKSSIETTYKSVDAAKRAGKKWMKLHYEDKTRFL